MITELLCLCLTSVSSPAYAGQQNKQNVDVGYALTYFNKNEWKVRIAQKGMLKEYDLPSKCKMVFNQRSSELYMLNSGGTLTSLNISGSVRKTISLRLESKPVGYLSAYDLAWMEKDARLLLFDYAKWAAYSIDLSSGKLTPFLNTKKIQSLSSHNRVNSDIPYWTGFAISQTGRFALSVSTDRPLFANGIDFDSDTIVFNANDKKSRVISKGAPVAWYKETHLLTSSTKSGKRVLRFTDLKGKVAWERLGILSGAINQDDLAVVEKDELSNTVKLVVFGLPRFNFKREFDLGNVTSVSNGQFVLIGNH